MRDDPVKAAQLSRTANAIWTHLESQTPGWGVWPSDVSEALAVGLLLGLIIEHQANLLVMELPEEDLVESENEWYPFSEPQG